MKMLVLAPHAEIDTELTAVSKIMYNLLLTYLKVECKENLNLDKNP